MMIRAVLRNIREIYALTRHVKNWDELALSKVKNRKPTRIILKNGIVINAPKDNTLIEMAREIFVEQVYLPHGWSIEANDVVVDIGANIGFFTLYAALKTTNRIYAFEPFPENVEWLKKNLETNNLHNNITVDCIAVSDVNVTEKLYISETSGGHLLFDHNITGQLARSVEVPSKTLETIIREHGLERIDFLKMDCEGSEGQILKAVPMHCLEKIKKIAMEFHDNVSLLNHDEIVGLLEKSGFLCSVNWDGESPFGYLYAKRD